MNKKHFPAVSEVSLAVTELMPNIIRGVRLDLFTRGPITQTQFFMLVAIQASGRIAMSDLAADLGIKMPTATGLADRLEASGYVKRTKEPGDRRKVFVQVTPSGAVFFQKFRAVMRRRWEEVLLVLDPDELARFERLVIKLRKGIESGGRRAR